MSAISTGSVTISTLINGENALAAYKGLHLNRYWENLVIRDNTANQQPISSAVIPTCLVTYALFTTFNQIETTLFPERVTDYAWGFFPDPRGPYFYAALLLAVLNGAKFFNEANNQPPSEKKSQEQAAQSSPFAMKCLVVVSKATPYLMIITNIAVTIIQIQRGDSSAWATLAFTGITLIDIAPLKPKNYAWYRDTVLGYPVTAVAFYYADNEMRWTITKRLAWGYALSNPTIRKMIEERLEEFKITMEALKQEMEGSSKPIMQHKTRRYNNSNEGTIK
jgi:hypothetical protein